MPEKTDTTLLFTVLDASGVAINLGGKVLRFAAKESPRDTDADKLFDVGCTVTDATNGKCEAVLPGASLTNVLGAVAELSRWDTSTPISGDQPDARTVFTLDIRDAAIQTGFP